jgi:hypothetical protein
MLRNRSIRSSALLGALVLGLTAVVTSASAAQRDTTVALALAVRPSVTALHQPATVYVTEIDQGSWVSFETVTVQFKECGLSPTRFRDAVEVPPTSDHVYPDAGNWIVVITPVANGTFRATIGPSVVSNEVRVLTRVHVRLAPTRRGRYRADVQARLSFRGKHVRIERYDRGRSRWAPLRMVVLDRTDRVEAAGIKYVWSRTDEFALKLPAGTKLRAVLPLSQAKPCYAAGGSQVLQT